MSVCDTNCLAYIMYHFNLLLLSYKCQALRTYRYSNWNYLHFEKSTIWILSWVYVPAWSSLVCYHILWSYALTNSFDSLMCYDTYIHEHGHVYIQIYVCSSIHACIQVYNYRLCMINTSVTRPYHVYSYIIPSYWYLWVQLTP